MVKEYSLQIEGSTNEPFNLGSGVLLITKMLLYDGTAVQQVFHIYLFRVTILRIQILCSFFAHEQLFTNNYLPVASHIKKNFGYSVQNNSCQKSAIFFFLSIKTKSTEVSSNEGTKRGPVGSLYQFL